MITSPLLDYLSATKVEIVKTPDKPDVPSRARFVIRDAAVAEARERLDSLLAAFPVYPQLDLQIPARYFR